MSGISIRLFSRLAVPLVLTLLAATPVRAQDTATSEADRWTFHISPYVWFVSLDGEATTTASTTPHTGAAIELEQSLLSPLDKLARVIHSVKRVVSRLKADCHYDTG